MSYRSSRKRREEEEGGEVATTTTTTESRPRLPQFAALSNRATAFSATATLQSFYGMGMWRVAFLASCLFTATHATAYTEGGSVLSDHGKEEVNNRENEQFLDYESFRPLIEKLTQRMSVDDEFPKPENLENNYDNLRLFGNDEMDFEYNPEFNQQQQQQEYRKPYDSSIDEFENAAAEIAEQLKQDQLQQKQPEKASKVEDVPKAALPQPKQQQQQKPIEEQKPKEVEQPNLEVLEDAVQEIAGEPLVPQKKGQNEFVSFVEPVEQQLKQMKSSQIVDKRRLLNQESSSGSGNVRSYNYSSLLLLAVGTVMSVGLVGTVAGGAYYLKRRNDTPDDGEYAPYAGTGPGFKKNKGNQGDETLAYKAQLHQYQQAKQKIICGEDAPGMIESDGEDGADEENNFSVYECPGLAPTGDIEVCNPNFAAQP